MRCAAAPQAVRWHRVARLLLAIVIAGLGASQPAWSRARFGGFHFREPRIEHRQSFGAFGGRFHTSGTEAHEFVSPTRSRSALGAELGEARANRQALDALDADRARAARAPLQPQPTRQPHSYSPHSYGLYSDRTNGFWNSLLVFAGLRTLLSSATPTHALAASPPMLPAQAASAAERLSAAAELHHHAVADIVLAVIAFALIAFAVRRSLRVADANDPRRYRL